MKHYRAHFIYAIPADFEAEDDEQAMKMLWTLEPDWNKAVYTEDCDVEEVDDEGAFIREVE